MKSAFLMMTGSNRGLMELAEPTRGARCLTAAMTLRPSFKPRWTIRTKAT
jgi:hypothetical protein